MAVIARSRLTFAGTTTTGMRAKTRLRYPLVEGLGLVRLTPVVKPDNVVPGGVVHGVD